MKKILLALLTITLFNTTHAQTLAFSEKINQFTAIDKHTYQIGDTLTLGMASTSMNNYSNSNRFRFVYVPKTFVSDKKYFLDLYRNRKFVFLSFRKYNKDLTVGVFKSDADLVNAMIDIDGALQSGEMISANPSYNFRSNSFSNSQNEEVKYTKLKKLKELLDTGIITQTEFDSEKKKILNEN